MAGQFTGKVAVVTGGGSGIGRASAIAFAREGANVVVADVNSDAGKETVATIQANSGDGLFIQTDVSNGDEVEAMVHKAVDTYGRLDYAFNNAGILRPLDEGTSLPHELTEDHWDRTLAINLKGIWLCMKSEIAQMLKQDGGAIVNSSSIHGHVAVKGQSAAYTASKHGIIGLTKSVALEYAQMGIRANAICPGGINTPLMDGFLDELLKTMSREALEDAIKQGIPMGRFGGPEEIAETVIWLCSDASSYVTGHALVADGGSLIQ